MTLASRRPAALVALLAAALAIAACGGGASVAPSPGAPTPGAEGSSTPDPGPATSAPTPTGSGPAETTPAPASPDPATPAPTPAAVLGQAWATAELVDVATGDAFTVAGLVAEGRTVILETMAVWCSNCLAQQERIEAALERVDAAEVAYVVVTVDPSEDAARLAAYRRQHGFDGRYAVAGRDVSRALAADFGDQVLNPPSTPVIVISPSGRVTLTGFGPKSVEEIEALVEEHRA